MREFPMHMKTGQSSRPKAGTPAADPGNFVGSFIFCPAAAAAFLGSSAGRQQTFCSLLTAHSRRRHSDA
jgi:hypothetical protein